MAKKGKDKERIKGKNRKKGGAQGFPVPRMFCLDGISPCNPAAHSPDFCAGCGG